MSNENSLRILHLRVEDFQKITVVDVSPDAGDVSFVVGGDNEAGKSSLLNAVALVIEGIGGTTVNGDKPSDLVRRGASKATISADLGHANGEKKYTVSREIGADGKHKLVIKGASGKKVSSTQGFLDDISASLGFDPGAFIEMKADEQFMELRRIANIGPEMDEIDKANAADYEERRDWNRLVKEYEAAVKSIEVPDGLPAERVDVAKLLDEMTAINKRNQATDAERRLREEMATKADDCRKRANAMRDTLPDELAEIERRRVADSTAIKEQIEVLQRRLLEVDKVAADDAAETTSLHNHHQRLAEMEEAKIRKELEESPELAGFESTAVIEERITSADEANRGISLREKKADLEKKARFASEKAESLTKAMEARTAKKLEIIQGANIPVPGIGFGDRVVTLNGLPFRQASDGEQWRTAAAIAMAGNQEIKVVLLRRASLIGPKNMKLIEDLAKERGYHLWLEVVGEPKDDNAIVMVDGTVRKEG